MMRTFEIPRRVVLSVALLLVGCGTLSPSAVTVADAERVKVRVRTAPPAAKHEAPSSAARRAGYVWVAGAWESFGGDHIWRKGHFIEAHPGYDYVPASYEYDGRVWWFHIPHWKRQAVLSTASARR